MRSTENVPARSWPNRKLAPTHTSTTCSHSTSTVRTNVSGSQCESSRVNRTTATPCMPDRVERLDLLLLGHQQRRRLVGPQHSRRMGIERHRGRRSAALSGPAPHAVDDLHVPAMEAVEVPQRQHRVVPAKRRVVGKVGNQHSAFNMLSIQHFRFPPPARHTRARSPAGQLRARVGVPKIVAHVREAGPARRDAHA